MSAPSADDPDAPAVTACERPDRELDALDSELVLEGLGDAVVVGDDRNRIVFANAAAERLLGWPRQELIGESLTVLIPTRLRTAHLRGFARYLTTSESTLLGHGAVRVPAVRRDGVEVEVDLTLSSHTAASGRPLFIASLRDLSDRIELERQEAMKGYLVATRDIATRLGLAESMGTIAEAAPVLLSAVGDAMDWDVGVAWDVEGKRLSPISWWARASLEAAASEMAAWPELAVGEGLPGRVLASGDAEWIEDLSSDGNFTRAGVARRHGLRSGFAFPIVAHGSARAVIEFFTGTRRRAEPGVLAAMAHAGHQVGRFLERERSRRDAVAARSHHVALAQALQASLLPPVLPSVPGMQVASAYHAASGEGQVGGDFYDLFPLGDERWVVAIGDVCGRGPEAAALTALARYTIRAAAVSHATPSKVLEVVNEALIADLAVRNGPECESFLTAVVAILQGGRTTLSVRLANAGHPLPMVIRPDRSLEEVAPPSALLGVVPGATFTNVELELQPGDRLILLTDGAFEGKDADGGQFGEDRLRSVVAENANRSVEAVVAAIETAVLGHTAGLGQDDLAIVVLGLDEAALPAQSTEPVADASSLGLASRGDAQ